MSLQNTIKLFNNERLSKFIDDKLNSISKKVDDIPKEQFIISHDDEIVAYISSIMSIEPIVLYEDKVTAEVNESEINVTEIYGSSSNVIKKPGTRVEILIPFTGNEQLWYLGPPLFSPVLPEGFIESSKYGTPGKLHIIISVHWNIPNKDIREEKNYRIELIKEYINNQEGVINNFNKDLERHIRHAIDDRRQRLEKLEGLVTMLDIPLIKNDGMPDYHPINLQPRIIIQLPKPPNSEYKPEPGITDETYENILTIIRHGGRSFEATPKTFNIHDEEELRDIILAFLNTYYKGGATGETFRRTGKTDIRIESDNRSAFIAECKIWEGSKELENAIKQLLDYLTWRDCRCSLVIFNKHNIKFSELLDKIPEILRSHQNCYKDLGKKDAGEWRFILKSKEDETRKITIHVFLFNLFVQKQD